MSRPRDRHSALGLLPRMEARPRKDGLITYRFRPVQGKPIKLGTDKAQAIRLVIELTGRADDRGSINELWRLYRQSSYWLELSEATRRDYEQASKPLLKVFGRSPPGVVKPAHVARYMRVTRKAAPVRANREASLLSNLMNLAVERGDIDVNPCKQVRRNTERPRQKAPDPTDLKAFLAWAARRGGQAVVLAGMAEFSALTGNRRIEFIRLAWPQASDDDVVRLMRAKQRGRETVDVVHASPALLNLLARMRAVAHDPKMGYVFPTARGNAYTDSGFKSMWAKLMSAAVKEKVVAERFTFHDLRAYYVTQFKRQHGALPDLHANPGTTARIYDRNREVDRRSL